MNKLFKFFLTSAAIAAALVGVVSCQKDFAPDIEDLNKKVNELTTKLNDLQTSISNGEIVTAVTSTANGVTIQTNKGSYTITNGKDGQDGTNGTNGANGKDGSVVTIGENGNWFIDGTDTGLAAAGTNGVDGKNGEYYVPNAETGKFDKYAWDAEKGEYVKTATDITFLAPGTITAVYDPEAGTLTLIGVDGFDGPYVLSLDGKLKSLVFLPQVYIDGVEGMCFDNFSYTPKDLSGKDSKAEKQIDKANAKVVNMSTGLKAEYHVNPANADLSFLVEGESTGLSFIKKANVGFLPTRGTASDDFDATPIFKSFKDGILTVEVQVTGVPASAEYISVLALNVELEDGEFVTSDYATLMKQDLDQLGIAFPNDYAEKNLEVEDAHYRRASIGISEKDSKAYVAEYPAWTTGEIVIEDAAATCDVSVKYNSTLDLKEIVAAHKVTADGDDADATPVELDSTAFNDLGLSWEFAVVKNYKIGTAGSHSETDQADFVEEKLVLEDGIFQPKVFSTAGEAAIGRTPIIRVALKHGDDVIEYAYIKVFISDKDPEQTDPWDAVYDFDPDTFAFSCEGDELELYTTVEYMNVQVYNELKMSKDLFHATYDNFVPEYVVEGITNVGTVEEIVNEEVEGTHILKWTITSDEAWENAGKEVKHVVAYQDSKNPKIIAIIVLQADIDGINADYNVTTAKYYPLYWFKGLGENRQIGYDYAEFNVQVPTNTEDADPENCQFINNLNGVFIVNEAGVLDVDEAVTAVEYFFYKEMAGKKKIGNIDVTFTIKADGLELWGSAEGYEDQLIAKITNNAPAAEEEGAEGETTAEETDTDYLNSIEYMKDSKLAKALLNEDRTAMFVWIGAKGKICGDDGKPVAIKFNGKDYFEARYVRPLTFNDLAADNFIDGVNYGEPGSYILIEKVLDPIEWRDYGINSLNTNIPIAQRKYPFVVDSYLWDYYGEFKVTVDEEDVDIEFADGTVMPKHPDMKLQQMSREELLALVVNEEQKAKIPEAKYEFLTYFNNGQVTNQDFYLRVNVTVEYGWGVVTLKDVKVLVKSTIGQDE